MSPKCISENFPMKKIFYLYHFDCDIIIRNTSLRNNFAYVVVKKLLFFMKKLLIKETEFFRKNVFIQILLSNTVTELTFTEKGDDVISSQIINFVIRRQKEKDKMQIFKV